MSFGRYRNIKNTKILVAWSAAVGSVSGTWYEFPHSPIIARIVKS